MMQTEVAEKADISNNFYSNIERGKTKPSVETLIKICKALDLSLDSIIFEEKVPKEEINIKNSIKEFQNVLKGEDPKSIESMIKFCNSMIIMLNQMKDNK